MSEGSLHALTEILAPTGVPDRLAPLVHARLGDAAADALRADPWGLLVVPAVRPERADAFARARLGSAARPDDTRRIRAIAAWLLGRAARDGHTAMPAATLHATLAGYGVSAPAEALTAALPRTPPDPGAGRTGADPVMAVELTDPRGERRQAVALVRWARAEEQAAAAVRALLAGTPAGRGTAGPLSREGAEEPLAAVLRAGVSVLDVPAEQAPGTLTELTRLAGAAGLRSVVLDASSGPQDPGPQKADVVAVSEARLLDVDAFARLAGAQAAGTRLVLVGDTAELPSPGPGRVLADLVTSGAVDVVERPPGPGRLPSLARAVREGVLPPMDPGERETVVVPAIGPAQVGTRLVQLVGDSIPRTFAIPAGRIGVLTPARHGTCGATALGQTLARGLGMHEAPPVLTVHEAGATRWEAVVLVLPGEAAGMISRELVYTALNRAGRHLSVIHAAGPALAQAVTAVPRRARRTRLADLLTRA
jgi:hypothetical protein